MFYWEIARFKKKTNKSTILEITENFLANSPVIVHSKNLILSASSLFIVNLLVVQDGETRSKPLTQINT